MSLKYHAAQDGPNRYRLAKTGEMNCDVVAFLSPALYDATDEGLWQDAAKSASYPGAKGVYPMPDCHKGYVLPVGGVLVTDETIVQAGYNREEDGHLEHWLFHRMGVLLQGLGA